MINPRPEIKTLDVLAEWCEMTKWDLQYRIVWDCKRCANFTQYINHDENFRCLNNARLIPSNAVALPVTSFNSTSKQFTWFALLGPHGGETISHQQKMQHFSRWGQVKIAKVSYLLDAFLHG
jgi:hypothetical protein